MQRTHRILMAALIAVATWLTVGHVVNAQSVITNTTFSSAVAVGDTVVNLTSATNALAGNYLYVDTELMRITAVNGTSITVTRGSGAGRQGHTTSAVVFVAYPDQLQQVDPVYGSCTSPGSYQASVSLGAIYKPWINITNGNVWLCLGGKWQATNPTPITYNSITVF